MSDDAAIRNRFQEQGCLVLPGVLGAEECARFLALVRAHPTPPLDWIKGHAATSRPYYEIAARAAILDQLERVLGPDFVLWGAGLVVRAPGDVHPWHCDIESAAPQGGMASVWIGLENTRATTSLTVVSGSHRYGLTVQEMASRRAVARAACDDERIAGWADELAPGAVITRTDLRDGDALLFDGRLWHGSHNTDPCGIRTALLLQYARAETPVRMADFGQLSWPFRYLPSPPPPCLAMRGDASPEIHRLVPPPGGGGPSERPRTTTRIQVLPIPLDPGPEDWRPYDLFATTLADVEALQCHVSGLRPGASPHPPHRHAEEEILLMLDGEADLLLPELPAAGGGIRHRVRRGQLAYYPAGFLHTLEAVGERPASYFMMKWLGSPSGASSPLAPGIHDLGLDRPEGEDTGSPHRVIFDGPTGWLGRLHAHLSTWPPGAGYAPHADAYDVLLVTLEGEIETLGTTVGAHHVVVYGAGEPHGLRVTGPGPARYVVFELDGRPHAPRLPESATTPGGRSSEPAPEVLPVAPEAGPVPARPSPGPRPLPVRTALHALAHSLVFWLRGLGRRLGGRVAD